MTEHKHDDARGASTSDAELERMAFAAGFSDGREGLWWGGIETLARFAELIAAQEREACAKVCDAIRANRPMTGSGGLIAEECAVAIQMRSND